MVEQIGWTSNTAPLLSASVGEGDGEWGLMNSDNNVQECDPSTSASSVSG